MEGLRFQITLMKSLILFKVIDKKKTGGSG